MSETLSEKPGKPGIVILVAILQFFSSALFFLLSLLSGLAILFGASSGIDEYVTKQMSQVTSNPNFSYSLAILFGVLLVLFLLVALFFLMLGIGLLRGKKYAWYLQVLISVFSTLGLLSLPLSMMSGVFLLPVNSILNVVILVFFFQDRVRRHFKV